jgi:Membrane-associated phospholipid phosphatase
MLSFLPSTNVSLFWLINSHHNVFFDCFFSIVTNLGNGWVVTPVLLTIVIIKVPRQKLALFIASATFFMVGSGLINTQIKQSFNRPRPLTFFAKETGYGSNEQRSVHAVGERLYWNSFPSGHSNTAFAAATMVALRFGGVFWLAYVVACLTGYSRIYMGTHFPSDVAAGAFLGVIIMWIWSKIYLWYDCRRTNKNDKK